jgi:general stress protein 26
MMATPHDKAFILERLRKQSAGILGTVDRATGAIRQRVMFYGSDDGFRCYLMSTKESPKIGQILSSQSISFIVFGPEEPYDRSWEIELDGRAEMLTEKRDILTALELLKGRNPFADVAVESGITRQFDLLRLIPSVVRFRIYGDALKGDPPTVLEMPR